jgi:hypothetical protein
MPPALVARPYLLFAPLLLSAPLFALGTSAACAQSTGMGVVLPNPTPRQPDPRVVLQADQTPDDNTRYLLALRDKKRQDLLQECNQILILAHQLHLKLVEPKAVPNSPSNAAMTSKIVELARKVQKDEEGQ